MTSELHDPLAGGAVSDGDKASLVRRTEVRVGATLGVIFEPVEGSDHVAVVLGGSFGGIPEGPARRLAENGVTTFALGYFGAPGLPAGLVEIPIEKLQQGIEFFRGRFAEGRGVGVLGFSKGAELALLLAAESEGAIARVVAVAPSHVVWFGLKPPGPEFDRRSSRCSWSLHGVPMPFLPCLDVAPVFTQKGLRTDAFMDLSRYEPVEIDAARIPVERSAGPILLLSGDDDHQWPAAVMAAEIVQRMADHGRRVDVSSVVYPGAGHVFFLHDFLRPPVPGTVPSYDFGGTTAADLAAGKDAWRRVVSFLEGGALCCQIASTPRELPAKRRGIRCLHEVPKRHARVPCDYSRGANGYEPRTECALVQGSVRLGPDP